MTACRSSLILFGGPSEVKFLHGGGTRLIGWAGEEIIPVAIENARSAIGCAE